VQANKYVPACVVISDLLGSAIVLIAPIQLCPSFGRQSMIAREGLQQPGGQRRVHPFEGLNLNHA